MRLIFKYLLRLSALFVLLLSSCERQELKDPSLFLAHIPITMDWSQSYVDEDYTQNVSIYFFPKDGSEPYLLISGDIHFAVAEVPVNDYSVLIFNDVVDNLLGIRFDGTKSYNEFKMYADSLVTSEVMYYHPNDQDLMLAEHDRIASWSLDNFSVTDDMVTYTRSEEFVDYIAKSRSRIKSKSEYDTQLDISTAAISYPESKSQQESDITQSLEQISSITMRSATAVNSITVGIENLNNAVIVEGVLRGTSSGVHLVSNSRLVDDATKGAYKFNFTKRNYDSNNLNGTVYHELTTFGKNQDVDARYELILNVIIGTGQLFTFTRDVTDQVNASDDFNIVINLIDEYGRITLPESQDDGFGVTDWEDGENVQLN